MCSFNTICENAILKRIFLSREIDRFKQVTASVHFISDSSFRALS